MCEHFYDLLLGLEFHIHTDHKPLVPLFGLKNFEIFTRYGIPEVVVSDNGLQYSSEAYAALARQFQFERVTSSPRYPQSNGEVERAVRLSHNLFHTSIASWSDQFRLTRYLSYFT